MQPYMTPYERDELLGDFAKLIEANYPLDPEIIEQIGNEIDPIIIAKVAMRLKKIPLIVRREMTPSNYEDWAASELITPEELHELPEDDDE
jgi:hypothetical protein